MSDNPETTLKEEAEKCFVRAHPATENDFGGGEIWHIRPKTLKNFLAKLASEIEELRNAKI